MSTDAAFTIDLSSLSDPGITGLTVASGSLFAEAAAVCLHENGHQGDDVSCVIHEIVSLEPEEIQDKQASLRYPPLPERAKEAHADLQYATEQGAYGMALLVASQVKGLKVLRQSIKGTGFDYWLTSKDGDGIQEAARLEVSGLLCGKPTDVRKRVRQKWKQTERTDYLPLPKIVIVTNFGPPSVDMVSS